MSKVTEQIRKRVEVARNNLTSVQCQTNYSSDAEERARQHLIDMATLLAEAEAVDLSLKGPAGASWFTAGSLFNSSELR